MVTSTQQRIWKENGATWYCPNGHPRVYTESENDKLKNQLRQEKQRVEWANSRQRELEEELDATERSLTATKGVVTKMKKRAVNGICPCCRRNFQNLQRHMHNKHPDFEQQEIAGALITAEIDRLTRAQAKEGDHESKSTP